MEIYINNIKEIKDYSKYIMGFGSLPNLKKLTFINRITNGIALWNFSCNSIADINLKCKHIILKNIRYIIIPESIPKVMMFAQANNIKLEII